MAGADMVGITERIAANRKYHRRWAALSAADDEVASAMFIGPIAMQLINAAGTAFTRTGRRVKLDQSKAVLQLMQRKADAAADAGIAEAELQVYWCAALRGFLDGY